MDCWLDSLGKLVAEASVYSCLFADVCVADHRVFAETEEGMAADVGSTRSDALSFRARIILQDD